MVRWSGGRGARRRDSGKRRTWGGGAARRRRRRAGYSAGDSELDFERSTWSALTTKARTSFGSPSFS